MGLLIKNPNVVKILAGTLGIVQSVFFMVFPLVIVIIIAIDIFTLTGSRDLEHNPQIAEKFANTGPIMGYLFSSLFENYGGSSVNTTLGTTMTLIIFIVLMVIHYVFHICWLVTSSCLCCCNRDSKSTVIAWFVVTILVFLGDLVTSSILFSDYNKCLSKIDSVRQINPFFEAAYQFKRLRNAGQPNSLNHGKDPFPPNFVNGPNHPDYGNSPFNPNLVNKPNFPDYGNNPSNPNLVNKPNSPDSETDAFIQEVHKKLNIPDSGKNPYNPNFFNKPNDEKNLNSGHNVKNSSLPNHPNHPNYKNHAIDESKVLNQDIMSPTPLYDSKVCKKGILSIGAVTSKGFFGVWLFNIYVAVEILMVIIEKPVESTW